MIRNDSGAIEPPDSVVRRSPRAGLRCRNAAIIPAFSPPLGCAWIAAWIVSGLTQAAGILGVPSPVVLEPMANHRLDPELARNLRRRPAPVDQLDRDARNPRLRADHPLSRRPAKPCACAAPWLVFALPLTMRDLLVEIVPMGI